MFPILLAAAAGVASSGDPSATIIITASREPAKREDTAASVTVIDGQVLTRIGQPLVYEFLRLVPSAAVSSSGPSGTQTQVRIRGAEAKHTLLFIDGIKANDLSFGDEPRFELLNADIASRIEVVRGPQSALWGSQAIGGVVAVNGTAGDSSGYAAQAEAGSYGFARALTAASLVNDKVDLAGALGWQRATGTDVSGTGGDRDGYHNLSGRALASWKLSPAMTIGVNGFSLNGYSEFDGSNPFTFAPTQNLSTRFGIAAARLWGQFGSNGDALRGSLSASFFRARNHNLFENEETSSATGTRRTLSGQVGYRAKTGPLSNELVAAAELEDESFSTLDKVYGINSKDERRRHEALTGEWKATVDPLVADVAVRRDLFSRFKDATTVRASLLAHLGDGVSIAGSYGEGIAPPTFTELYGFFPGSFTGNPNLKPETSRGYEASIRYDRGAFHGSLTGYRQRLHDEIVGNADFTSSVNAPGVSRRSGVEAEASWSFGAALNVSATYAYLHATQPDSADVQVAEIRRPKHSGSVAITGSARRLSYGASLSYVGRHTDTYFNAVPFRAVELNAYWHADARLAYAVKPGLELFGRASNLLNQRYEDVLGYRTEGRAVYAGVRLSSAGRRQ